MRGGPTDLPTTPGTRVSLTHRKGTYLTPISLFREGQNRIVNIISMLYIAAPNLSLFTIPQP